MFELMTYDPRKPVVGVECLDRPLCYTRRYPASPCIENSREVRLFKSIGASFDLYDIYPWSELYYFRNFS